MILQEEQTELPTPTGPMRTYVHRLVARGRYPGPVLFSEIPADGTHQAHRGVAGGARLRRRLAGDLQAMNPGVSAPACFYATDLHKGSLGLGGDEASRARGRSRGSCS